MELSPDQQQTLDACLSRLAEEKEALLCGAAGTGKTTLIGHLGSTRPILCMAPTNAAARILRTKLPNEIPVSTIHAATMSLSGQTHRQMIRFVEGLLEHIAQTGGIKNGVQVERVGDDALASCAELQSLHNDLEPEQISQCIPSELLPRLSTLWDAAGCRCAERLADCDPQFMEAHKRAHTHNRLKFSPIDEADYSAELLVVDEASMCTTEHRDAIRSAFGDETPLLWAGDPAQLPPVIDEEDQKRGVQPVLDFVEPTATLTTQHRQASDSILLACLDRLRSGKGPFRSKTGTWPGLTVQPRPTSGITKGLVKQFANATGEDGVVICWRNTTRRRLNHGLRALRGFDGFLPLEGDRLVVVMTPREPEPDQPDWSKGTLLEVLHVLGPKPKGQFHELELRVCEPGHPVSFVISTGLCAFLETYKAPRMSWALYGDWLLDYGYALTAHKAQGNEWPRVGVYEERAQEQETNDKGQLRSRFVGWAAHRQWLYTALSRAQESALLIVQGD